MFSRFVCTVALAAASLNAVAADKPLAAIDSAVVSYNALPSTRQRVSIEGDQAAAGSVGKDRVVLPTWLQQVPFTVEEARAIVVAYAAYEAEKPRPAVGKNTSGPAGYVIGAVVAQAAQNEQRRRSHVPPSNTADILNESKPPKYRFSATPQWPSKKVHFTTVLVFLDSCVGAFHSAVAKAQEVRSDTDIERLRKLIIADFDYQIVPPSSRCRSSE